MLFVILAIFTLLIGAAFFLLSGAQPAEQNRQSIENDDFTISNKKVEFKNLNSSKNISAIAKSIIKEYNLSEDGSSIISISLNKVSYLLY